MRNRKEWIDVLRAIAIILVVLGHQIQEQTAYFVWTSPIKMPLFFAISGYLFTLKPVKDFAKKIFVGLVIPWFCLGLLPQLLMMPVKGIENTWIYFGKMISGEVLWFMPCFILGMILFYLTVRISSGRLISGGIASVLMFAGGLILYKHYTLDFASLYRAMAVQPFFWFGHAFRQSENTKIGKEFLNNNINLAVAAVLYVTFIASTFYFYPGRSIDVHLNRYFNIPICALQILMGLYCLFVLFQRFSQFPKWIVEIGKCSLVIYIWHGFVIAAFMVFVRKFIGELPLYLLALINCFIGVTVCCLLNRLFSRYAPFMTGNR